MKICFSPLQCNCVKIRKLNVLVRHFFFIQIKCEIIFHVFSLFMHTFSRYCNYNVFRHVDRFLFGARDAGVFELWFTRYLKKGHFATTKRVLILWSELIHLSTRLNTPIDKYGMTLRLKWSKNLFFLRYNWIFHKLI